MHLPIEEKEWLLQTAQGELSFVWEDNGQLCLTMRQPTIALTMTALFTIKELHAILNHPAYMRVIHTYETNQMGTKKVKQTIVTNQQTDGQCGYSLTFLSEDTVYVYPLSQTKWTALRNWMQQTVEGIEEKYKN